MKTNKIPPEIGKSSSFLTTVLFMVITSIIFYFIYKKFVNPSKNKKQNSIIIIGPGQSGKTSFFYYVSLFSFTIIALGKRPNRHSDINANKRSSIISKQIPSKGI